MKLRWRHSMQTSFMSIHFRPWPVVGTDEAGSEAGGGGERLARRP